MTTSMTAATGWTLETSPVIDTDSHVAEPPDLWTSRLSEKKWGDLRPRVVWTNGLAATAGSSAAGD